MTTSGGPTRAAGRGILPDGRVVTWVVSEGRRGRRWRETITAGDGSAGAVPGLRSSLLLETDPEGRFLHLELSTAAGLLTLHPEGNGTIHGNAGSAEGVRHVVGLPFPEGAVVVIDGSPIGAAAALAGTRGAVGSAGDATGRASRVAAAFVGPDLIVATGEIDIRATDEGWRMGEGMALRVDEDGLPLLPDASRWPLELEASWMDRGQPGVDTPTDSETRG